MSDDDTPYDWIMLGEIGPKTRVLLKRYGFKFDGASGYWRRVSGKRPSGESDIIMETASEEYEAKYGHQSR